MNAASLANAIGCAIGQQLRSDTTTGLPGRRPFLRHTQIALDLLQDAPQPQQAAVVLLDLDDFALVTDSMGQNFGDTILVALTKRLRKVLRQGDLLARVGADEFAVLLLGADVREAADAVADRLSSCLKVPIMVEEQELFLSACVGISLSEGCSGDAMTLLQSADAAVRRAKRQGRGGRARFLRTMRDEARARLELEADFQRALHQRQFILYYQPVVSAISGRVVCFEALVRWPHPERGIISPGKFLPLAEETGLILPLSWQLLSRACREAAEWTDEDGFAPSVSVNIAAAQIVSPELLPRIRRALQDSGLPPQRLKLEITESCLIDERRLPTTLFEDLAAMGMEILLDDFGTGYSSLSYLERYALQGLKIDRSFVRRMRHDARRRAITRRVIELGRDLGMTVIAEGVETIEELQCLQKMRCELVQGYYFARPMPFSEVRGYLLERARAVAS